MRINRCVSQYWLFFVLCLLFVGTSFGQSELHGSVTIEGDLTIRGNLMVTGNLTVGGRIITSGENLQTAQTPEEFLGQLWNLDQQHNGLSVTLRNPGGEWQDETAAIRLDEQDANRNAGTDGAPAPLIVIHDASKLSGPTYQTVQKLFDNYHINANAPEDQLGTHPAEDQEVENFLNAVLNTQVMETSLAYINQQDLTPDGEDLNRTAFKALLKLQWFELYTNHFSRPPKEHISGFEHVFVGDRSGDRIGGHHFWWKFFLDQEAGQADSLGHSYRGPAGERYRWLATFRMKWQPEAGTTLTEPGQKGFFVGPSPELMLAYGTLGLLLEKKNNGTHSTINFDGGRYELVIHASTLPGTGSPDSRRGDQIRSVFPILRSVGVGSEPSQAITVAEALATALDQQVRVIGVITGAHNEEFGLRLADAETNAPFLAIKLPRSFRASFSPKLNPNALGLKVTIGGRRGMYTGVDGIVAVHEIQPVE